MSPYLIVAIVVPVLLVLWLVATYNGMVRGARKIDEAWSGVDVQLRRRHDLVPNLLSTVQAYAAHESSLLTAVAAERGAAQQATGPAEATPAEASLTVGVRSLLALAEAYPNLKASENFVELQEELTEVEDQINASRNIFNGNVRSFNTKIQSFPAVLVAKSFGFAPHAMFTADPDDRLLVEAGFAQ